MTGLLDFEAPVPITVKEAAELVGTSYSNARNWLSRGLLTPIAKDRRGNLVDRNEVFALAARTRRGRPLR